MSEEEQKYFKGLIGFTFDSDDIRYIEKIVDKKDKEIERLNKEIESWIKLINYNEIEDIPQYIEDLEVDNKSLKKENKEINKENKRLNNLLKETSQTLSEQTTKAITLKSENERLNNKLKDIKSQLDYLETYSSKEDVFEDMKRRLNRIDKIIGS